MTMYDDNAPHTEEDIKHLYIPPAIERGWPAAHIRMEAKITDGRFNLRGNLVARERPFSSRDPSGVHSAIVVGARRRATG